MNNLSPQTLIIDKEFKSLIRPLRRQEYLQLESNILADGCLDPIITWNGIIVDGHNRYEICHRHKIPFHTIEKEFASRDDVVAWICANQLGRRNISEETRKFLIGMQYEKEKVINARKNASGNNQYGSTDSPVVVEDYVPELLTEKAPSGHTTAQRIAKENNISYGSVLKYSIYAKALDEIGKKDPNLLSRIMSGRYKISHQNIIELAKMSPDELRKFVARIDNNGVPYVRYSRTRSVLPKSAAEPDRVASPQPSVKDMPTFDPDASITELTLTIPSWVSSIKRTQSHANFSIATPQAKNKLFECLNSLKDIVENLLSTLTED